MRKILTRTNELHRTFAATTERVFQSELGIANPPLTDYIANLLMRFVRISTVYSMRNEVGERLFNVTEMVNEARKREGWSQAKAHRELADFILFWTGFYPEALKKLRHWSTPDASIDYPRQARESYEIAGDHMVSERDENHQATVFFFLSDEFDLCVRGLYRIRCTLRSR